MPKLQDRLDEFKKTLNPERLLTTRSTRRSKRCIERQPSSKHQGLKIAIEGR